MATYTTVWGDTLGKIAKANGMTLAELLDLNPEYKANPNMVGTGVTINLGGDMRAVGVGTLIQRQPHCPRHFQPERPRP